LVSRWIFAPEDVAEKKAVSTSAASREDFAAMLHDDVSPIDFLFHAQSFERA
jgi:hypothetical protein